MTFGCRKAGIDADDMRVGLGLHQTRKPVAGGAADAGAVLRLLLVEHDADRQRERAVAGAFEIVRKLLDARLVRYRRVRVRVVAGRLGRVAAALTVDVIETLGLGVIRREIAVRQRPFRRHAVGMRDSAEIALAQSQQYRAVHLRIAADPIVNAGMERLAVAVVPGLRRLVPVRAEHRFAAPILRLARQEVAAFEDQDALAGRGQAIGERAAAGAAADDDDIVLVMRHGRSPGFAAACSQ